MTLITELYITGLFGHITFELRAVNSISVTSMEFTGCQWRRGCKGREQGGCGKAP